MSEGTPKDRFGPLTFFVVLTLTGILVNSLTLYRTLKQGHEEDGGDDDGYSEEERDEANSRLQAAKLERDVIKARVDEISETYKNLSGRLNIGLAVNGAVIAATLSLQKDLDSMSEVIRLPCALALMLPILSSSFLLLANRPIQFESPNLLESEFPTLRRAAEMAEINAEYVMTRQMSDRYRHTIIQNKQKIQERYVILNVSMLISVLGFIFLIQVAMEKVGGVIAPFYEQLLIMWI